MYLKRSKKCGVDCRDVIPDTNISAYITCLTTPNRIGMLTYIKGSINCGVEYHDDIPNTNNGPYYVTLITPIELILLHSSVP